MRYLIQVPVLTLFVALQGCQKRDTVGPDGTLPPEIDLNKTVVGWLDYISTKPAMGNDDWSQTQLTILLDERYNISQYWIPYFSFTDRHLRFLKNVEIYTDASLDDLIDINAKIFQANVTAVANAAKAISEHASSITPLLNDDNWIYILVSASQIAENPLILKEAWMIQIVESFRELDQRGVSQVLRVFFSIEANYAAAVHYGVSEQVSPETLHEILSVANATIIVDLFNNTQIAA